MRRPLRTTPYSPQEMRELFATGDTVAQVYMKAWRIDRAMTKDRVRAILFDRADA